MCTPSFISSSMLSSRSPILHSMFKQIFLSVFVSDAGTIRVTWFWFYLGWKLLGKDSSLAVTCRLGMFRQKEKEKRCTRHHPGHGDENTFRLIHILSQLFFTLSHIFTYICFTYLFYTFHTIANMYDVIFAIILGRCWTLTLRDFSIIFQQEFEWSQWIAADKRSTPNKYLWDNFIF